MTFESPYNIPSYKGNRQYPYMGVHYYPYMGIKSTKPIVSFGKCNGNLYGNGQ